MFQSMAFFNLDTSAKELFIVQTLMVQLREIINLQCANILKGSLISVQLLSRVQLFATP